MVVDIVGDASHIGVVKRSVNLVQHKEGGWLVRMDSKEQSQRSHSLLATG